jgi:type II secretory pathway component PulC
MTTEKHRTVLCLFAAIIGICCGLTCPAAAVTAVAAKVGGSNQRTETPKAATANGPVLTTTAPDQRQEILRKGNLIIVSRPFVDQVMKNNEIVLSTVAIKSRLDKNGLLEGFQLFQIDRGSVVEKMGFKAKDILTNLNGIPAKDLEANRRSLETADHFDVTILRNGKEKKLQVEIR